MRRTFYRWDGADGYEDGDREPTDDPSAAQLVGSRIHGSDLHLPLFDIDYDADLLPSTTPGHFHLYLNKPVHWDAYVHVLEAMRDAELQQVGYVDNMIRRGGAFLRTPHTRKPT